MSPRSAILIVALVLAAAASPAQARHRHHRGHGRLPWCGLWMMQAEGKTDRRLALAREWAKEGSPAGGPGIGVIVVYPHHVAKIVGQDDHGQWIMISGNDGNRVRTRPRSIRGAIAFRRD